MTRILTSKTPRHLPSLPMTPASSSTSRIAVTEGSSSGSTPPPGTIQLSGRRDDVTRSTCATSSVNHGRRTPTTRKSHNYDANLGFGVRPHADTRSSTSEALVIVNPNRIRLLFHHYCNKTRKHELNRRSQIKS